MNKIKYLEKVDLSKNKIDIASEAYDKGSDDIKVLVAKVLKTYVSGKVILDHIMEMAEKEKFNLC
jgi:hypothetical protein